METSIKKGGKCNHLNHPINLTSPCSYRYTHSTPGAGGGDSS